MEQFGGQWNTVVEQCGGLEEQWNSVGQFCGTLEQCSGTEDKYGKVWWNSMVERRNSVRSVEQYAGPVEQYN